ncbi:LCP family protein [Sedimentibacter sp. zth1]|uniref:LCP family protein n=1 Tax=Sedimentibacter sp. zth1 TaxID=2816908 RepID=UPI001A923532|nr:LCP family protein [Sedimentibacter sp. zth1]QSX05322.1 LCP family protein [Sedimentibacter sp. zth1]
MIGHFFKVFFITFFIALLTLGGIIYGYIKISNPIDDVISNTKNPINLTTDSNAKIDEEKLTPFKEAIKNSKRLNVLVVGFEHNRTDAIMVVSFDRKTEKANIIAVPRDTYYKRDGYKDIGSQKINAIYQSESIDGLIDAVEEIMSIPIHRYVTVDYDAVKKCVDILGGVEVNIPFEMSYHDEYDTSPLSIEFQPGKQLLNGQKALEFLRFRKNDDGSRSIGDIGRIKLQQEFIKNAIKKTISYKLGSILEEMYKHIDTNFSFTELIDLTGDLVQFSTDDLKCELLPGEVTSIQNLSFVKPNYEKILKMVYELYGLTDN